MSLVFRTEDVWQKCNQFIETVGALNQGFPFSPLQCRGVGGFEEMCTMHAVIMLSFWH